MGHFTICLLVNNKAELREAIEKEEEAGYTLTRILRRINLERTPRHLVERTLEETGAEDTVEEILTGNKKWLVIADFHK